jgi:cation diffusion facilitator family transporter
LAEAAILALVSLFVAGLAVRRLTGTHPEVDTSWYVFAAIALVMMIDVSRTTASYRASRQYRSAALGANAVHFASDFAGSTAVLVGLLAVRGGVEWADSAAALVVAGLVITAAGRLIGRNVEVLMDRSPVNAHAAARAAIDAIDPPVELRRLRVREAGGRHFADVVIGLNPGTAVAQAHSVADTVEDAVERALRSSDVVVHVEPIGDDEAALRERVLAAALRVPLVREIHNVSVLSVGNRAEVSLHLKLPGRLSLGDAHGIATRVESAIQEELPFVGAVHTHLEPLSETALGTPLPERDIEDAADAVTRVVRLVTGSDPLGLRFLDTETGLVAFLTVAVDPAEPLADAHERASTLRAGICRERPEVADVVVHTEPWSDQPDAS